MSYFPKYHGCHGFHSKCLLVTLYLIGLFFFLTPQASANNLLTNSAFENGITDWDVAGPNWEAQNAVVYSGAISVKNTIGTIPSQDYFASLSQTKTLSAGQTVYVTLRTKTNINVSSLAVAGVLIEFYNASDVLLSKKQDEIGGLTDWRSLYVSATAPAATAKIKFHAFVYAPQSDAPAIGGLVYFDEAVLSTDAIAPPPAQTTLFNTGFENGLNDWNLIYSPAFVVDNQTPQQGNYSVKNTIASSPGQDFFSSAYQDLAYQGGMVYASAYAKTNMNPASSATAGFLLEFYNQFNPTPGTRIDFSQQTLVGMNDWMRLLINGVTPPAGTVMIRVHEFTYTVQNDSASVGGTADFDQIVFSYQPLPINNYRTNILNSGFENGLSEWSEIYGFPGTVVATPHSGVYSGKKSVGQIEGQDYYSQVYQDIYYNTNGDAFPPGIPVYASGHAKAMMNPITKSKAGLQLEFINAQGQVIEDGQGDPIVVNDTIGGQTNWRYLYVTRLTPAGTAKVRVSGFTFAREQDSPLLGDSFFDDFQFSLTALTVPAAQTVLLNGNFENGLNDWDELTSPGEVTTNPVHGGNYAAWFEVDNSVLTQDYFGSASQEIKVSAGYRVNAGLWAKTNINPLASGTVVGLSIAFFDNNNQQIGLEVVDTAGGIQDWAYLVAAATAPSGTVKVKLTSFLFGSVEDGPDAVGARAYFDDAILSISSGGGACSPKLRFKRNSCPPAY